MDSAKIEIDEDGKPQSGIVPINKSNFDAVASIAETGDVAEPWNREQFLEAFSRANWKAAHVLDGVPQGFALYHRDKGTRLSALLNIGVHSDHSEDHNAVEMLWGQFFEDVIAPSRSSGFPDEALIVQQSHLSFVEDRVSSLWGEYDISRVESIPLGSDRQVYCAFVPSRSSSLVQTFYDHADDCERLMQVKVGLEKETQREWLLRNSNGTPIVWSHALSYGPKFDSLEFVDTETDFDVSDLLHDVVNVLSIRTKLSEYDLHDEAVRAAYDYSVMGRALPISDALDVVEGETLGTVIPDGLSGVFKVNGDVAPAPVMEECGLTLHIPARFALEGNGAKPYFEIRPLEARLSRDFD